MLWFVKQSRIAAPPEQVFAFHARRGALEQLAPPWQRLELVEGGDSLEPGSRVVLKTRIGPFPVRWVAEHTELEVGRLFADTQLSGPFARWYHRHWFLDDGAGGKALGGEGAGAAEAAAVVEAAHRRGVGTQPPCHLPRQEPPPLLVGDTAPGSDQPSGGNGCLMRALMGRLTGPTGIPDARGGGEECAGLARREEG